MLLVMIPKDGKNTHPGTLFGVFSGIILAALIFWLSTQHASSLAGAAFAFLLVFALGLAGYGWNVYQKLLGQLAEQQQDWQSQEQRYGQLLLGMQEGLFVHGYAEDGLPGKFREVNQAACRLLGYQEEELLTLSPLDIDAPEHQGQIKQVAHRVADESFASFETVVRRKDGSNLPVEIHVSRIKVNGEALVISLVRDISARQQVEAERSALVNELTRKNRNLEQFAHLTSHNLRAPVANMQGLLSLYDRQHPESDFNLTVVENLQKAVGILDQVLADLNELLLVRDPLPERRQWVAFGPVLEAVTSSISVQLARSGAQLTSDFSAAPQVEAIGSYLHSILLNLLTNAIKYRSPARTLQLQMRTAPTPEGICLSVTDNGLGMDLGKVGDRLFGLYQRFHAEAEGKGLGLHLVKTQVEALGGSITVESRPGVGTTFRIYFAGSKQPQK